MKRHDPLAFAMLAITVALTAIIALAINTQYTPGAGNPPPSAATTNVAEDGLQTPTTEPTNQPTPNFAPSPIHLSPPPFVAITPGPPPVASPAFLEKPITTQEDALTYFAIYDNSVATWETPWYLDGRLTTYATLEYFPDIITAEAAHNRDTSYSQDLIEQYGPVWTLTITGTVQLATETGHAFGGVRYILSSRTGRMVGYDAGPILNP